MGKRALKKAKKIKEEDEEPFKNLCYKDNCPFLRDKNIGRGLYCTQHATEFQG